MDESAARDRLHQLVARDQDPVLTVDEVDLLLEDARRPDRAGNLPSNVTGDVSAWASSTAYLAGQVVKTTQTPRRYWRAQNSGVSAATTPSWPDYAGVIRTGNTLTEGSVRWEDIGADWAPTFDIDAAAAAGWRVKASKAAGRFDFTEDGQSFSRSQVVAHCNAMAASFEKRAPGSPRTPAC